MDKKNQLKEVDLDALTACHGGEATPATRYVTRDPGSAAQPAIPAYTPSWVGSFFWSATPGRAAVPARQAGCSVHANAWQSRGVLRPEARTQLANCVDGKD